MSQQQNPLTRDDIFELFRQTDLKFKEEATQRSKEFKLISEDLDRRMKETDQRVGSLGTWDGQIVENMIYGDIVSQFQELGYERNKCSIGYHDG